MSLNNLHIVIAEDDPDDAELILSSFKKSGLFSKIDLVNNGVELLEFLQDNRQALPGFVLMDLRMPKKDAFETLALIHKDAAFAKLAIFIYSTGVDPNMMAELKAQGAIDVIRKPFSLKETDAIPALMVKIFSESLQL